MTACVLTALLPLLMWATDDLLLVLGITAALGVIGIVWKLWTFSDEKLWLAMSAM